MIGDIVIVDAGRRSRQRTREHLQVLEQKRHAGEGAVREASVRFAAEHGRMFSPTTALIRGSTMAVRAMASSRNSPAAECFCERRSARPIPFHN